MTGEEVFTSVNTPYDLDELQGALDERLALEVLEERLELGCWVNCDLCLNETIP